MTKEGLNAGSVFHIGVADLLFSSVSTEVVNPEECAQLLRHIASTPSLSPQYWLTLHCLLRHFARVCQNCSKNLLSARALGEIFSPVFFRQQATRWVSEQPDRASLLHTLSKIDTQAADRQVCRLSHATRGHTDSQTCTLAGTFQASTYTHTHTANVRNSWLSTAHRYRLGLFYLPAVLCN